ncbi:MAG: glycosyltransferase [Lachnospiraceae bacterium]|nr:glycosyltransferase [Lachnospiraceae bacterium]
MLTLMKILFYRYGSICEPDMILAFGKLGLEVLELRADSTASPSGSTADLDRLVSLFTKERFLFVFTVNFFPPVSEVCNIYRILYVCWTVDSPVPELFSPALSNTCNRIFYFDRAQYRYFSAFNPSCSFHLPLATNPKRWNRVISGAAASDRRSFSSDISFVGSLYSEKNPYRLIKDIPAYAEGYIRAVEEAQLLLYGVNFVEDMLNENIMDMFLPLVPDLHTPLCENSPAAARYVLANSFIGCDIASIERTRILTALAAHFDVDLYTASDTSELSGVHVHKPVASLTEMPLVFNGSRINLNITLRSIQSGLSLRNFDICGCGGFLMTNYQEELPELYEPGVEAEYFSSTEELLDKCAYYLDHEEDRAAIAKRGYERTVSSHSYDIRIAEMIRLINSTI